MRLIGRHMSPRRTRSTALIKRRSHKKKMNINSGIWNRTKIFLLEVEHTQACPPSGRHGTCYTGLEAGGIVEGLPLERGHAAIAPCHLAC